MQFDLLVVTFHGGTQQSHKLSLKQAAAVIVSANMIVLSL